ncbi:MAG TPA: hypothetical protein VHW23_44335 [Kofleriaceae bacterium]|nr:hypothetical protein [Kofleriaceae bacterium]
MIVIWLVLVVPAVARAQGSWLQKGVSGVSAEVTVSHDAGSSTLGLTGGYSHQGFLDVGVTLAWIDANIPNIPDLSAYSLGAELVYHPLKQTKTIPLSVEVETSYTQDFFSSDTLSANGASVSQWGTTLGAGAYRFFPLSERIGVSPLIEFAWRHQSATLTLVDGSQTTTDDAFVIGLSAALAYLDSAGHIWGVAPAVAFGPGDTPTGVGITVIFIGTLSGAR